MIAITTKTGRTPYFKIGSVLKFSELWMDGQSAAGCVDLKSHKGHLTLTDAVMGGDIRIDFVFTGKKLATQCGVMNASIRVTDIN